MDTLIKIGFVGVFLLGLFIGWQIGSIITYVLLGYVKHNHFLFRNWIDKKLGWVESETSMNLHNLKREVERLSAISYNGEESVCIELDIPGLGGVVCVPVKSIYLGIDWDSGRCIIKPEVSLIKKDESVGE